MTDINTARWGEPVDPKTYNDVGNEVDRLYGNERFQEAYDLLEITWPGLPETDLHPSKQDCVMFKAFLLAHLDRAEETFEVIQSVIRCGFSWGLSWKGLDLIRSLDGYAELEQENVALLEVEKKAAVRKTDVKLPEGYEAGKKFPLCLVLHGDGDSMTKVQEFWTAEPLLARGFIVVYVQSSQLVFTERFAWLPNPDVAWKDIQTTYSELCERYTIDEENVLLGGFSGGAITAVDLVFGEAIPASGFICLCPEYKPAHFTPEAVTQAVDRGVRGVFIEGALVWPLDDEKEMMDVMQAADLPIHLILNEGLGHAAPPDFDAKLRRALDFVLQ